MVNKQTPTLLLCGLLLGGLLAGCVSQPQKPRNDELKNSIDDVITNFRTSLPGQYNNYAQRRQQPQSSALTLNIQATDKPTRYLVEQISADNPSQIKRFFWQFSRDEKDRLLMDYAPMVNNSVSMSCRFELLPQPRGIHGLSDPETCLIPTGDGQKLGLTKEFLIEPNAIQLGERVENLTTETAVVPDQKLEFRRQIAYRGWAGIKNEASSDWDLAIPFELHNQGGVVELQNVAEEPIGYRLELAEIKYREDQPEVLRLVLIDSSNNQQVAYSWAALQSQQVGINLGWFQAGLQRVN